jgi:hypothetical protein
MNAPRYNPPREGSELAPVATCRPPTPRTDSLARSIPAASRDTVTSALLEHARELERELEEALQAYNIQVVGSSPPDPEEL